MKLGQLISIVENDPSIDFDIGLTDGVIDEDILTKIIQQYGNIYQELEMSNHFVNAHRDVGKNTLKIQQHSHNFYELIYVYGGSSQYLLGTKRYAVKQDDVIIIAPGTSHKPIADPGNDDLFKKYVFWISNDFVKNLSSLFDDLNSNYNSAVIRTSGKSYQPQVEEIFKESVSMAEIGLKGTSALLAANATKFFVLLSNLNIGTDLDIKAEEEELQDKALKYIEKHLSEQFTSLDCATYLHVSDSTLRNICTQKLGVSFHRCVIQRRLIAAKTLMANDSSVTLDEIAVRVGFEDYSSFFRSFKKEYNLSPKEYKNSIILQKDI